MIKHFSVLYVGQIELENIGRDGTPADARRYPNERLIESFGMAEEVAVLMDDLGFYALWTAEHHFQHEGYECFPNLILLGTHLASRTKRLKFGCGFNIVPMWHPLRLAEDYAMADILTGGRVIFGIGRGYHTREVETFGAPMLDNAANMELFEEQMEVIFKAFNEESFSHQGKHYTIPPHVPYRGYELREITLVPRPMHRPVEIWQPVVSGNPRGIGFMFLHGIKVILSPTSGQHLHQWVHLYRDTAAHYGQALQLGEHLALSFRLHLADTMEQAVREARAYFEEQVKFFAPLQIIPLREEQLRALAKPTRDNIALLPSIEDSVTQRNWLCGTEADATALLQELEAQYPGVEQVIVSFAMGTPKAVYMEQLTRFAEEVMPAFKRCREGIQEKGQSSCPRSQ